MGKKFAIGIVVAAMVMLVISGAAAIFYVLNSARGETLANEGYVACLNNEHDLAITKLTAALGTMISGKERASAHLNRGLAYNAKLNYADAIRDFDATVKLDADNADAHADRGIAYRQKGDTDKALADFTKAIALDPNQFYAFYYRGLIYLEKHEWDRAIADFKEAARCDPRSADSLLNLGLSYLGKNDPDHALASFDGAIAIDARDARAYAERSKIYSAKNDWNRSFRDLTEAEKLNPSAAQPTTAARNTPKMYVDLTTEKDNPYTDAFHQATAAYANGDFDRAIQLNDRLLAMEISPSAASTVVMNRGNDYRAKGDWDAALRDYDEALKLNPRNAGAYVDRAAVLSHKGEHEDALKDLDEALRMNPSQWQAYFNRAADLRDLGRFDEAFADVERMIKLNPKFSGAYVMSGSVHLRKGEIEQTLADYKKAVELDPLAVMAYEREIVTLLRENKGTEASWLTKKIMEVAPQQSSDALNSVAWFLATSPDARARDGKGAVKAAERACKLSQWKDWASIDTLAAAFAETGDFDQALKYQERVLQIFPAQDNRINDAKERLSLYQQHKPYRQPAPQS